MKLIFVSITLVASVFGLNGQTNQDSLLTIWQNQDLKDSVRVNAYSDYIWIGALFENPEKAIELAKELEEFSNTKNYMEGAAKALRLQGIGYSIIGEFKNSLASFNNSLQISTASKDLIGVSTVFNNIGNTYYFKGDYYNALEYFKKSLRVSEEIDNLKNIGNAAGNVGMIYDIQGDYPKALKYYTRALAIHKETKNLQGLGNTLLNIGALYGDNNEIEKAAEYYQKSLDIRQKEGNKLGVATALLALGRNAHIREKFDKATSYIEKSLSIYLEVNDKRGIAEAYLQLGVINAKQKNISVAIKFEKKGLAISENIGDKDGVIDASILLANLYQYQKNYKKASELCIRSYLLATEIGSIDFQKIACECLYETYKAMGNGSKALEYHEKMLVLNDSLKSEETAKKLQQMEFAKRMLADSLAQVEKDLKVEMAHQSEVRKKDRNRNLALGAGIFFLALSGGFYSRWRYVKKSKAMIEKEKDRSENLLLNILPAEIAEELKEKGKADARDFDLVSILFTDFKGFTEVSEQLTAQELISEINECFEAFDNICEKYGIEKIKTIGDAYMAAGGLPVPTNDSVKNTVMAGLEMQQFMLDRKNHRQKAHKIFFEMRVGVHTGPVVAGIVGVKKFQYDIWGDTVNTAARIESSGEIGKVNLSEDTFALLKNDSSFTFSKRGIIKAKSKGPMKMYFVEFVS